MTRMAVCSTSAFLSRSFIGPTSTAEQKEADPNNVRKNGWREPGDVEIAEGLLARVVTRLGLSLRYRAATSPLARD
jgi:hypothetical protein